MKAVLRNIVNLIVVIIIAGIICKLTGDVLFLQDKSQLFTKFIIAMSSYFIGFILLIVIWVKENSQRQNDDNDDQIIEDARNLAKFVVKIERKFKRK